MTELEGGTAADTAVMRKFFNASADFLAAGLLRLPPDRMADVEAQLGAGAEIVVSCEANAGRCSIALVLPDGSREELVAGFLGAGGVQ